MSFQDKLQQPDTYSIWLPPVYVKENESNAYYQYLADIQGYGGSPDVFYAHLADLLMRSQQLVLDAIEGKEFD